MDKFTILVVEDDEMVCQSLKYLFIHNGWETAILKNPHNLLEHIPNIKPDLVILDMNFRVGTGGEQGLEILKNLKKEYPNLPVFLFTAWGSMQLAIEGMKLGASDFITKPWDNENLVSVINTHRELKKENKNENLAKSDSLDAIIGSSEAIQNIKKLIAKVARTNATVLITGESGTGKELVAKAIHDLSDRSEEAFVKVNLGAIPQDLFESEMFGHKKGAFTSAVSDREGRFAIAEKGTLFLDEIGDLSLNSQVKLLRALQEKTYEAVGSSDSKKANVRIITATHRPLEDMVQSEQFREDLYYRINLLHIHLPDLSERKEDIPLLVQHFINQLNNNSDQNIKVETPTLEWLSKQIFPGNIRQLKNVVERTYLLSDKKVLGKSDFQPHLQVQIQNQWTPKIGEYTLEEIEKNIIAQTLEHFNGNITEASKALGITRNALYRRIEKYGLNAT